MNTGLVIIDVQNDYFPGGKMELSGMENAAEKCRQILDSFRKKEAPVFHIRHIAARKDAAFLLPDTIGSKIHECVKPEDNEVVVVKHFPNSFRDTGLDDLLQNAGVKELVICGAMTHMCVDTTVRAAFDLGYACSVISDACATRDLEFEGKIVEAAAVQNAFMASLKIPFARLLTVKEFLEISYDEES
jgi:nicotinamidase-related amidase